MKIQIDDLEFNSDHFYIQSNSIVEKIIFNNRTFYSKYEKIPTPISQVLLEQYQNNEVSLALPLIENGISNYIVIEYQQEDWKAFHSLIQHLLKTLDIENSIAYRHVKEELLQIFIPRINLNIEKTYEEVEQIKHLLDIKSKRSYKIFPNKNLPKNLNIINFPHHKM